jgi:MoaA/NifB/PqqE/SkfB family radical SAM enzyme
MRTILLLIAGLLSVGALQAQDRGLYWKYKDYDGAIAVSIPRWATFIGSAFLDEKEERKMLRKVRKVRVLFFEGGTPFTQRDLKKFARKAKRRDLDELITVRSGKTRVNIMVKERRNAIRKVVVLFSSPEGAGLVTLKGKFRIADLNKIIEKSSQENKKKDGQPVIPKVPKIPVIRA